MTDAEPSSVRPTSSMLRRLRRVPKQVLGINPFEGDSRPTPVPLLCLDAQRPSLPFPHRRNFEEPIRILETYFYGTDEISGPGKHNRYLDVVGFDPILVSRDPGVIRAVTTATGDKPAQFDRDELPSKGIARATGIDTLLYANGSSWRMQRKIAASPFGKTTLFQPEKFQEFEQTFRNTVAQRIGELRAYLKGTGKSSAVVELEPEIKAVMLEMLVNNFFGGDIPHAELKLKYVPALERVIDHIVQDTVTNKLGVPINRMPSLTKGIAQAKQDYSCFEELTDHVLEARHEQRGLWTQFKSDASDEALRSNIKVFLAGALEATTSFASWAISHLARSPECQQRVFDEVDCVETYVPDNLKNAHYLCLVLEETLRLTPSLYFLPRRATADTWIETSDQRRMWIPSGTHILLDVWHANRNEEHWGEAVTGYPAIDFVPDRWREMAARGVRSKDMLHFGFGHGPRVCPGKHLGQLEVALVVGAFVKAFQFKAPRQENPVKAGVSTKPLDGTEVELRLREAF